MRTNQEIVAQTNAITLRFQSELIETKCGETTCASAPGNFCHFFQLRGFTPWCRWFEVKLYDENESSIRNNGWIQRCPQCMAQDGPVISGRDTLPKEVD